MGREADGSKTKKTFDSGESMTRAQFGTILSRLLYGDRYNTKDFKKRYQKHLEALNTA
jgi:hypothetical protein